MEEAAAVIDKQVDSNPLKKMFGFFKGERDSEVVEIPPIFSSENLFSRDVTQRDVTQRDVTQHDVTPSDVR